MITAICMKIRRDAAKMQKTDGNFIKSLAKSVGMWYTEKDKIGKPCRFAAQTGRVPALCASFGGAFSLKPISIAVDGPSGAGKSTLARRLAARLQFIYVDTGALYRAIAYASIQNNAVTSEEVISMLPGLTVTLGYEDGVQHVYVNGEDVSGQIRTPEVSMAASRVSALPEVRQFLFDLQQKLAREHSVVMDGRDIGTVVLPDADVKIFLTASAEKRAERRFLELREKQNSTQTYEEVLADVIRRDKQDTEREISPLRQAEDAVLVDTTDADLDESEEMMLAVCRDKLGL